MHKARMAGATALVASLALGVTACGTSADGSNDEVSSSADGEVDGSINVWTWDGAPGEDSMNALADAFEDETGVKVNSRVVSRDDYTAQVQLALNSGEKIDVLGVQPSQFATEVQGSMRPVSDYEDQLAGGMDGYSEVTQEQIAKLYGDSDEVYSVPFGSTGSAVCFYNADILEKAGVGAPETWDDVADLTAALKKSSPDTLTLVKPSGADTWFEDEFVLTMVGQNDPGFFDAVRYDDGAWNTDAYTDTLQEYGSLYEDGTLQRSSLDLGYGDAMTAFNTGKAAIVCNGSWEAGVLLEDFRKSNDIAASEVGVIPVPADDPSTRSARSFLDITWGIPKASENAASAAAFIDFATQGDGVDLWAENLGFVPAAADWELDPSVFGDDQVGADGYATIQSLISEPSSDRNNLSSLSAEVGNYVLEVAQGRLSAKEAADKGQEALESGLYN